MRSLTSLFALTLLVASCGRKQPAEAGAPAAEDATAARAAISRLAGGEVGILVTAPTGAETARYDVYDATGTRLHQAEAAGQVVAVAPGSYHLTQYFNDAFTYATDLTVEAGATTELTLGALELITAPGSETANFDLYDASGEQRLSQANPSDRVVPVPAGSYVIKQYFNPRFTWAGVAVTPGSITEVQLGSLRLVSAPGSDIANFDIYDTSGEHQLSQANGPDRQVPVPAGTFVLKQYFNAEFTWATEVVVVAGANTDLPLGAIRWAGDAEHRQFDLYEAGGARLLSRANPTGHVVPAPAGTYALKIYFTDTVIADGVAVVAGEITEVP